MPYNIATNSFHTKKLCSRLSSSQVRFFYENRPFCVLETPLGDLGATYDDRLRLIGKRLMDIILAVIELFFASYEPLSVRNRRFCSNGGRL